MNSSGGNEVRAEDRLQSVPVCAVAHAREHDDGASLAHTAAARQSIGVKTALAALRIYKVYFSILFAGSCRFEPTCSRYAYEAIERFGVMRGSWMGLRRLLRCHPLSRKFGYDPVPEKMELAPPVADGSEQQVSRTGVTPREAHS